MKCPDCGGDLRVYRTYHKAPTITRHYCRCQSCGKKGSILSQFEGFTEARPTSALDMLTGRGLSADKAKALTRSHPASLIKDYCDQFPVLKAAYEKKTGKAVSSEGGFLAWAIEHHYPIYTNGSNGHSGHNGYNGYKVEGLPVEPDTLEPDRVEGSAEDELWPQVLNQLQHQMTRATFETWVKPTRLVSCHEGLAVIAAKDPYAKEWLENRLAPTILRALAGEGVTEVQFVVEDAPPDPHPCR